MIRDEAMVLLKVEHLSLTCNDEIMLDDVSFSLEEGEILALLGASGSGKTTLLRLLAGLEKPDRGEIVFAGQNLANVAAHKRSFGMMFQEYALFPHKNVFENVAFGLQIRGIADQEQLRRTEEILHLVGLSGYEQRRLHSLSGGEQQRVALARSLAPQPRLLLLDEPLAALDRSLRDRLADEIRSILKSLGITAIFVTHDQSEAFAVADRIAILHEGRLEQFGTPEEVYRQPCTLTVATFLGFRNFVAAHYEASGGVVNSILGSWSDVAVSPNATGGGWRLIRPDAARMMHSAPDDDGIILSGRVDRRQFHGRFYHLAVDIAGEKLFFDLPLDPCPPEVGSSIVLRLNPGAMTWLDAGRAEQ